MRGQELHPLSGLAAWLLGRSKVTKQLIISITDLALLSGAMVVSLLVVALPVVGTWALTNYAPLVGGVLLAFILMRLFGVHHVVSRHADVYMVESAFLAMFIASIILWVVLGSMLSPVMALAIPFLYGCMGFVAVLMVRVLVIRFLRSPGAKKRGIRVLIYGAGEGGVQLASALRNGDRFCPVVFVDSNPSLHGRRIHGLKVHPIGALAQLYKEGLFEQVLLAVPSATPQERLRILEKLESLSVKVLVMPAFEDIAAGISRVDQLREVQIEDLLPRIAVKPDHALLSGSLSGKVVLVTGAGGSIGSELCRQAMLHGAARILLLECSEYSLYQINQELRLSPLRAQCDIVPLLVNVSDEGQMRRVFADHGPVHVVYHAAAYKHVPLVEANPCSAVLNNVKATRVTVDSAIAAGVERFVLISTDKAVRPPNVMGASKRFCELVVQAAAACTHQTALSMVRFGNVLGSSGSVVPLFREQIRRGGPVTVTHPDVTRYFMTIPEAAQLVIQAGAMGDRGEVFLLQMGKSVRIRDLAERMIHLSGRTLVDPETGQGDVEIRYTGLRPGEKLYEELLIGAEAQSTSHPRIFKALEAWFSPEELNTYTNELLVAAQTGDEASLKRVLGECVSGYGVNNVTLTQESGIVSGEALLEEDFVAGVAPGSPVISLTRSNAASAADVVHRVAPA